MPATSDLAPCSTAPVLDGPVLDGPVLDDPVPGRLASVAGSAGLI